MVIINTADRPATCKAAWKGGRGRICQLIPPQRDNRGQSTIITGFSWPDSDGLVSTVAMHGQTSVCSAISKASSTSIPRYRMVLSSFVWPRRSWTALRFFVLR